MTPPSPPLNKKQIFRKNQNKQNQPLRAAPKRRRQNPNQKRRPAVVTQEIGNDAISDERWTYIRYKDGGEELYDRDNDVNEWNNLVKNDSLNEVKERLKKWLPENRGITLKPSNSSKY